MTCAIDYGSVCSGIEAASAAWECLGFEARWFAEIEPFPSAVLAHHWPTVPNQGDMTKLAREVLRGTIAAPLILVGGTPCQTYSIAGERDGLDDPRGLLAIKYVELADAVDHVRILRGDPECVFIWENVPGVLSDKANAFGHILGTLVGEPEALQPAGGRWTDAGCVYGPKRTAAWRILDAQYFGLAQRRRRVFVVASARKGFDPVAVLFEQESLRRDTPPGRDPEENPAGTLAGGARNQGGYSTDDIPLTVGALTAGCGPNGHGGSGLATDKGADAGHILAFGGNNQAGPINIATACNASSAGRLDFESETFVVHGTQDPSTAYDSAHSLGRNSGRENAVLAVHQNQRAEVKLSPVSGALQSGGGTVGQGYAAAMVANEVRRLTPRECERLQGFPDDYTLIPWRGRPAEECPDGPRYRALGNSKAVPVVRWIGERILLQLQRHSSP